MPMTGSGAISATGFRKYLYLFTAGNSTITPTPSEKLLGLNINENMKFHDHILTNEKSSRMNAVSKVSKYSSFKTRLMIANAVFNSVLIYMISVWGGSEKFVIRALHVMQNKVARCVTRLGWFTPTKHLLLQCYWSSVIQLATYHTALQVYKDRRDLSLTTLGQQQVTASECCKMQITACPHSHSW